MGMASFSRSEALRFAGAEGGGAAVVAATVLAELDWAGAELLDKNKPRKAARTRLYLEGIGQGPMPVVLQASCQSKKSL
jgi:hypothetical protein